MGKLDDTKADSEKRSFVEETERLLKNKKSEELIQKVLEDFVTLEKESEGVVKAKQARKDPNPNQSSPAAPTGPIKLSKCNVCGNRFEMIRQHMKDVHGIGAGAA